VDEYGIGAIGRGSRVNSGHSSATCWGVAMAMLAIGERAGLDAALRTSPGSADEITDRGGFASRNGSGFGP
jgi:hypothetical protein